MKSSSVLLLDNGNREITIILSDNVWAISGQSQTLDP